MSLYNCSGIVKQSNTNILNVGDMSTKHTKINVYGYYKVFVLSKYKKLPIRTRVLIKKIGSYNVQNFIIICCLKSYKKFINRKIYIL